MSFSDYLLIFGAWLQAAAAVAGVIVERYVSAMHIETASRSQPKRASAKNRSETKA